MTRSTIARIARETALTLGAILGALCLIATLVLPLLNMRLLVFTSGSMSPTISVGAAALARTVPADELQIGDIVSVEDANGNRITHRISDLWSADEGVALELTGDANRAPDAQTYVVDEADLVLAHLDGAGYVVDALSSPWASFAAGGAAVVLLAVAFGKRGSSEREDDDQRVDDPQDDAPQDPSRTRRAARAAVSAAGVLGLVLAVGVASADLSPVEPTTASFTDTAAVAAAFSTATVADPTPSAVPCTNGALLSGIMYLGAVKPAGAPAGYQFLIEVRKAGSDEVVFRATTSDETFTLARGDLPGSSSLEATYRGTLAGTDWVSPAGFSTPFTTGLLGWDIGCA